MQILLFSPVTDTWESYNSLNHFALNFMQYITEFITYTDAFMIEKLLLQICYIVIQLSFKGFQKVLEGGLATSLS